MSVRSTRHLVCALAVGAAAWLSVALPALGEGGAAPTSPTRTAPAPQAAHAATRPLCPELADNPFDEPARGHEVVDLNTADERALLDLPGIGPARARAILAYRDAHGGFRSISQLLQIRGIGRALLRQLRPLVTLTGPTR